MNILIIEDEHSDLQHLTTLLNRWKSERNLTIEIRYFLSAESFIAANLFQWPDVCLLDIQLSNSKTPSVKNGIELAKILRHHGYQNAILFLTAFREYVFDGYKVHALDYLLKPVCYENLAPCLDEIERTLKREQYLFRNGSDVIRLSYSDIISIHSDHHTVEITTPNKVYVQKISLENILCHLPNEFVRCHRTCIVNLAHITSFSHAEVHLSNMTKVAVGRSYRKNITQKFSEYTQHIYPL